MWPSRWPFFFHFFDVFDLTQIVLKPHLPNVRIFNAKMQHRKHGKSEALVMFLLDAKVNFGGLPCWFPPVDWHVVWTGPKRTKRMLNDALHEEVKDIRLPWWTELLNPFAHRLLVMLDKRARGDPIAVFNAHVEAESVAVISSHRDGCLLYTSPSPRD